MGRANSVSGVEATNEEVHGDVTSPSARTTRARRGRGRGDVGVDHHQVRSISHWSPYDRVRVVNADP
jgi:hypothetical protein